MKYFACLLDPTGRGVTQESRRAYEKLPRARGLEFAWGLFGTASVLTAWDDPLDPPLDPPLLAQNGHHIAAGVVRFDNREDITRYADAVGMQLTDLQLVLRLVARTGSQRIIEILGDFAFVVWNEDARTAIAATDAFSVRKLFYAESRGLVAFASRAEALSIESRYDTRYLTEFTALCTPTAGLTVYTGVRALPAATVAVLQGQRISLQRYWSPDELEPEPRRPHAEREAPEALRGLLAESVRQRLSADGNTWAHLSGGLDSSSIVSVAQWLGEQNATAHGLAGTVTYVDWQGTDADEREYSESVLRRWRVHNAMIVDPPLWCDGNAAPPLLDQPRGSFAFHPRDGQLCAIVRRAGGRVLLAGVGGDELFTGNTIFFADWLARGKPLSAVREMAHWAATGRVSFWKLAYGNAILPLVPLRLRRPSSVNTGGVLPWISAQAASRFELRARTRLLRDSSGHLGRKYQMAMVTGLNAVVADLDEGAISDTLEVRYPFFYRPLVEFALRLPPDLCTRPLARKWVLREAMRGILPEKVRVRIGKGASTDVLVRSLTAQRSLLEPLVHEPILADLGVIDAEEFRSAFNRAPAGEYGDRNVCVDVQHTLMLEAWLRMRSGRWPQQLSQK